jgi:parallel beta-helix repeat protein
MLRKLSVVLISAGALALGACSSGGGTTDAGPNLCLNVALPCVPFLAGTSESKISAAVNTAAANTTFVFDAATFAFTNTLSPPNVAGLVFMGQGISSTTLDFSGQTAGSAGISVSGNTKITFTKFTIQNTPGDGIKVEGGNGILFDTVGATWSNPSPITHGAYGLYPVQSQNILIQNCQVSGARDTGIYVGQSFNIIVRNNTVKNNVAGIEIESSVNADVYGNTATLNSGGILIFALPTLLPPPGSGQPNDGTTNVRVFNNTITGNNTTNFGDPSGTVAAVPAGTGSFVLASSNVEVFGNTITNNKTSAFSVVSYFLIAPPGWNPTPGGSDNPTGLNPFANNVYVHDNTFTNNGTAPVTDNEGPDGGPLQNQLGSLLALLVAEGGFAATNNAVPDMVWDGIANEGPPLNYVPPPAPTNNTSAGTPVANPSLYFIQSNGAATFSNLNFPVVIPGGDITKLAIDGLVFNAAPFTATSAPAGFPLPAVDAGAFP